MLEFSPSFPLEQLEEKIKEGYFDEEVYTYLVETLKEDTNDSKELITGEISQYDFFTLSILERDQGWRSHYITSKEYGTVDKEVVTLLKNRIDMLFSKAKSDLGIDKEIKIEVDASFIGKTINQLRKENSLETIQNGDYHFIKTNNLKEICNRHAEFTREILKGFMEELKKDCKSYKEVKDKLNRFEKEIIWSNGNEKILNLEIISYAKNLLDKEVNEWLINKPLIKE